MHETLQTGAWTIARGIVAVAILVSVGCELSPAEPTPVDPDRPRPTLTVSPGTVATRLSSAGTQYDYQACYSFTNPSGGFRVRMSEFEFIPIGADGTAYPASGISTAYPIASGTTVSECPVFQRFFATHPAATRYRLRVMYSMFDNPSILSVEGTSTLTPGTVPFR